MWNILKKSIYFSFFTNVVLYIQGLFFEPIKLNYLLNFFILAVIMFLVENFLYQYKKRDLSKD